jgi:hypothetical protein
MGNVEKLRTENQWFSTWYRYHLGSIWVCLKIVYTLQLWSFFLQMMRIHWVLHPTQATGSHVPGSLSLANMVECPVVGTQESVGNGQDVALFRFHMVPCEFSRMIFVLFTPNMSFLAVRAKHLPNISTQHSGIFNLRCNALWRLGCVIH